MPRVFRSVFLLASALVLAPILGGCDETPGPSDPFGSPPSITAFSLTPDEVETASTDPTVEVTPVLRVTVAGGSGEVTVRAFVRDVDGEALLAEVEASGGPGVFELRPTLSLPRGAIGDYEILVTTEDASGRIGDRASGVLAFRSTSLGAPVVTATSSDPATVSRPASGSAIVVLSADVADPDGVENIARVELRDPVSNGVVFRFADEGENGDAQAGDGRYTLRLAIASSTGTGTYRFGVVATDRTGRESASSEVSFTVQ